MGYRNKSCAVFFSCSPLLLPILAGAIGSLLQKKSVIPSLVRFAAQKEQRLNGLIGMLLSTFLLANSDQGHQARSLWVS